MKLRNLAMIKNRSVAAVCVVAAAVIGAAAVSGESGAESIKESDTKPAVSDSVAVPANAEDDAEDSGADVYEQMISFKKAGIEEYDMEIVPASQTSQTAVGKTNTEIKEDENNFTVKLPKDVSYVLKPEKAAAANVGSRSIAGEYYTVYDERSGSHVTLNGHELICRIVNSEIGDSWDRAAIMAQAVAAYSYVRFNDACGYIPSVGLKAGYSSKINECVSAVEGVCIYYNGSIIDAVYSASSAGASAPSEKIWGSAHPYLKAVESVYDSKDPNFGVKKTFTKEQLKKIIEKNTGIELSDDPRNWFEVESVFSGRYIDKMKLDGRQYITVNGTSRRVTGALMRSTIMGISNLKSTAFEISYKDGVFTFTTYGWGHGVGMSQWGACLYARAGYTYDQILKHYYTGVTLSVSSVNAKAVQRAKMTEEQLRKERESAKINKENETIITDDEDTQTDAAAEETPKPSEEDSTSASEPADTPEESAAVTEPEESVPDETPDEPTETEPGDDTEQQPTEDETAPADEQPAEETPETEQPDAQTYDEASAE